MFPVSGKIALWLILFERGVVIKRTGHELFETFKES